MKRTDLSALAQGASPAVSARINAAMGKSAKASKRSATARTAQRNGARFEAEVFAALDALVTVQVLAWWDHYGPATKHLSGDKVIVTGHAPCDVVGCTMDGRMIVAEVKRHGRRVVLDGRVTRDAHVEKHQGAQLTKTAASGGVALLIVEVASELAVIPWASLAGTAEVHVGTARQWSAQRSLTAAIRGAIERTRGRVTFSARGALMRER